MIRYITNSVDRALRLVIAKILVRFLVTRGFFRFFFNRLGCSFYCEDHDHFHNIIFVVVVFFLGILTPEMQCR